MRRIVNIVSHVIVAGMSEGKQCRLLCSVALSVVGVRLCRALALPYYRGV